MGMLTDTGGNRMTGASVALRVLVEARQDGLTDEEILARSPTVLALTAPRVARAPVLPEEAVAVYADDGLPELQRQRHPPRGPAAAGALGAGAVGPRRVGARRAAHGRRRPHRARAHPPHDPRARRGGRHQASRRDPGARVEPRPRLRCARCPPGSSCPTWASRSGRSAPRRSAAAPAPAAASAVGRSRYDADDPPTGSVLVTTTLSPGLGPLLPRLKGIVAETGSVLSHLAILAREAGVRHGRRLRRCDRGPARGRGRGRRRRDRTSHHPGPKETDVMKVIAWLAGIGTLLAGGVYMIVSLNRWEWNRALFFGLIVLIAEVGLATGLVLRRLARARVPPRSGRRPRGRASILRETRPPSPDRFAWLQESIASRLNVFITFLVGGGVHPLGRRLGRRPRRVEDDVARRRAEARPPARADQLPVRRAARSTTSRCWPRTCRAPTTSRSASCCAAAAARDQADAGAGRPRGRRPGRRRGRGARSARSHAVDPRAGRRATRIELVVSGRDQGRRAEPDPRRDGRGAAARRAASRSAPTSSGRSSRWATAASGPCWPRRWTRPTAASSAAASRTG